MATINWWVQCKWVQC